MFSYIFMKILERRPQSYDKLMNKASRGHVKAVKEAVVYEIPQGARILEIGCGTGELSSLLISKKAATVDGFDVSKLMVDFACKRIEAEGLKDKLTVRQMGVDGMDNFPETYYDAVVSTLVFSELSDDERRYALKHSKRVLKPNGVLIIADEVIPRNLIQRLLHTIIRLPMFIATYLISRTSTRPILSLSSDISAAGFIVENEFRSQGDAFALVVAHATKKVGDYELI